MSICPQCQGSGKNMQLASQLTVGGTALVPDFAGPTVPLDVTGKVICDGCNGTGIYRNFGV